VKRKPPHAADAACEVAESPFEGIGVYAESGLHASLKRHFAGPEDAFEVPVEGKVVDLVRMTSRGEELVEVQTKRLDKIAPKVLALAEGHRVRVVHPIAAETCIRRVEPGSGELLSERKSPKRGDLYSVFDELVRAPSLIGARNVSLVAPPGRQDAFPRPRGGPRDEDFFEEVGLAGPHPEGLAPALDLGEPRGGPRNRGGPGAQDPLQLRRGRTPRRGR
jgi:hypothetical protein